MKVEIYDQFYNVAGELDPDYLQQLAKYVDVRMRQVARGTGAVDSVKVAVLAALSIADELHALRQSREQNTESLRETAERCLKLIDRAINAALIAFVSVSIAAAVVLGAAGFAPTALPMLQRQSIFDRVDLHPSSAGQGLFPIDNAPVGQGWG